VDCLAGLVDAGSSDWVGGCQKLVLHVAVRVKEAIIPDYFVGFHRNRLDPWPRCRHSREGGNPVYFGLHGYKKSVWIPAFAGMTVAGSKRLHFINRQNGDSLVF
jgi:hypothetical protein